MCLGAARLIMKWISESVGLTVYFIGQTAGEFDSGFGENVMNIFFSSENCLKRNFVFIKKTEYHHKA